MEFPQCFGDLDRLYKCTCQRALNAYKKCRESFSRIISKNHDAIYIWSMSSISSFYQWANKKTLSHTTESNLATEKMYLNISAEQKEESFSSGGERLKSVYWIHNNGLRKAAKITIWMYLSISLASVLRWQWMKGNEISFWSHKDVGFVYNIHIYAIKSPKGQGSHTRRLVRYKCRNIKKMEACYNKNFIKDRAGCDLHKTGIAIFPLT